MTRRWTVLILFFALVLSVLVVPATVRADGLPVIGVDAGASGLLSSSGLDRYVVLQANEGTVAARVAVDDGRIVRSQAFREGYTIPAVAYDGSGSGLSHDGRTLVLIDPRVRFPRKVTRFEIVDTPRLRPRETVELNGDFSFDAISPDGSTMYLIEYVSKRDPARYAVRGYDVASGRLLPDPIVDRREPDEEMRGQPITRTQSADGRWAYTLYDGVEHPFVHALDTVDRRAFCIDLATLGGRRDLYSLRLLSRGDQLTVLGRDGALALIDAVTFEVTDRPAATAPRTPRPALAGAGAFIAGLLVLAAFAYLRLRSFRTPTASR